MKKFLPQILFISILVIVAFIYNYHEIILKRPQGIHAWRQCDGASVALNYSRDGMNFFQPTFHNLTSDQGSSGKSATSEMPVLYYIVAFFYTIFGPHEFIFRLLNTLIFFLGLFYLFRTLRLLFNDNFWAITIPIFLFTSPVLVYYANNFLPNTAAFSMVLIGWYFAFRYFRDRNTPDILKMFFFFMLAGALKVTALFSFFALAAVFFIEWISGNGFNDSRKLFPRPLLTIGAGIAMLMPIIAWIIYAKHYNSIHDSTYFSTMAFPFWDLEADSIRHILSVVKEQWLSHYFHPLSLIFLGILLLINLLFLPKNKKLYNFLLIFLFLGILLYALLQFWFFRDHDYYTINMYILPVLLLISTIHLLKTSEIAARASMIFKIAFAGFLIFNLVYAAQSIRDRYEPPLNEMYLDKNDFYTIEPHLREIGLLPEDRVISFSDYSHISLYLMDQKGWSRFIDMRLGREDPRPYNNDSAGIQNSIARGAKYLIFNGLTDLYQHPYLYHYARHLRSVYRNILIFDLQNPFQNFQIEERIPEQVLNCSAETLTDDGSSFIDGNSKHIFSNVGARSYEGSLSGDYSLKLNRNQPYGFSTILKDMRHGESVKVSVWKKGSEHSGGIVVQAEEYQKFNRSSSKLTGRKKEEWAEMEIEFFIPYRLSGESLKIYVYNPGEKEVYFDDFRIVRYQDVLGDKLEI